MAEKNHEQDQNPVDIESLEVTELDDQDLEDASGGSASNPIEINGNCPC